jgi:murein DD-endopeptidase MepM/ murein hydrolase activator NlpD
LIGFLCFGICSFVVAKFNDDPNADRFTTDSVLLDLPPAASDPVIAEALTEEVELAPPPADEPVTDLREINATVKPGDSLAAIFKRNGLSAKDVHAVSNSKPLGSKLRSIFPGQILTLYVDDTNALMRLSFSTGPLDTLEYERTGDGFKGTLVSNEPDRELAYKHGTIDHSLFVASQRAGLSDGMTMRLAQIFQWDVDFVLDIRPGDTFFVLYEELFHNDEFIGYGDILAAEFVNQGESFRATQYVTEAGEKDFYAPSGESMRKAFLRAPVAFSRISSNFNLRRVHPLFKTVRPHRGIDYAAPRGTPILAAGDGRVTIASRTQANGNYVVIQHGEQFVTKYLHLSKFGRGVKAGAKVKQGQTIGLVGATGWATAPHLHYEFLVNGVHKNPRTVSLPDADPIEQNEMPRFQTQTAEYAALLDNYKSQVTVALAR